jgi:hypothetical protein
MAAAAAATLDYLYNSCTCKQNIDPTTDNNLIIDLLLGSRRGRKEGYGENEGKRTFKGGVMHIGVKLDGEQYRGGKEEGVPL